VITEIVEVDVTVGTAPRTPNGAALAAFLGAGIGACAVGLFVILNETGLFAAPALYGPAGGVSGRTTLAAIVWLVAWGTLHYQWRGRELDPGRTVGLTLVLIAVGLFLTFPPVWGLF
jgi:hypothetical protein